MELGRNSIGTDGSEWILEGNDKKNYRVITQWSPEEGGFFEACDFLIELTSLRIKNRRKY